MQRGLRECKCDEASGRREAAVRLVAVSGAPSSGKTAVIEMCKQELCKHVVLLPESATLLFRAGFPRGGEDPSIEVRRAVQRAIFHVQLEAENIAMLGPDGLPVHAVVCDRGLLDNLSYWPGNLQSWEDAMGASLQKCRQRYSSVVFLESPAREAYQTETNLARIEDFAAAYTQGLETKRAWSDGGSMMVIPSSASFLLKLQRALEAVKASVPPSCSRADVSESAT